MGTFDGDPGIATLLPPVHDLRGRLGADSRRRPRPLSRAQAALVSPLHVSEPTIVPGVGEKVIRGAGRQRQHRHRHAVSVARMTSPPGWEEPAQTPEFDEVTVVLEGAVRRRARRRLDHRGAGRGGARPRRRARPLLDAGRSRVRGDLCPCIRPGDRSPRGNAVIGAKKGASCVVTSAPSTTSSRPTPPQGFEAAALQYVRKVSGMQKPSHANEAAFERAVAEVAAATDSAPLRPRDGGRAARPRGRGGAAARAGGCSLRGRLDALPPRSDARHRPGHRRPRRGGPAGSRSAAAPAASGSSASSSSCVLAPRRPAAGSASSARSTSSRSARAHAVRDLAMPHRRRREQRDDCRIVAVVNSVQKFWDGTSSRAASGYQPVEHGLLHRLDADRLRRRELAGRPVLLPRRQARLHRPRLLRRARPSSASRRRRSSRRT